MKKIYFLSVFFLFIFIGNSNAQSKCGSQRLHEDKLYHDSEYAKGWEQFQRQRIQWMNQAQSRTDGTDCSGGKVVIPIVVHFEYAATPAEQACLIALVNSQIVQLNQAYSGMPCNDPSGTQSSSGGCLGFRIANQNHPAGSGVAEGQPAILFGSDPCPNRQGMDGTPDYFPCAIRNWAGYLNVLVKNPITNGTIGIAPFPPQASIALAENDSENSVIITSCVFGVGETNCVANFPGGTNCNPGNSVNTGGTTTTHEIGHFLGLPHTFCRDDRVNFLNTTNTMANGGLNDSIGCQELRICGPIQGFPEGGCGQLGKNPCNCDGFADTPDQAFAQYGCPGNSANATGPNPTTGMPYSYNNYMDYVDDACMQCFSVQQANQIRLRSRDVVNRPKPNVFMDGNNPTCPAGLAGATAPPIQVTNSTCAAGQNTPNGGIFTAPAGCPVGSTIQYSTNNGANWSATLPTYNQTTAMTVLTRCNCNTDNAISSQTATITTVPGNCAAPACPPNLAGFTAPQIIITNSTCPTGQTTPSGGSYTAPVGCPAGSTIQYSTDQGQNWSNTLPQYDQTNPMFVDTRCLCDADNTIFSTIEVFVQTTPGPCMGGNMPTCPPNLAGFTAPQVTVNNSTCPAGQTTPSGGSFTAPAGCSPGSTIQYSTDQGQNWSNTLPQYDQTNPMFVDTRCLCDTDNNIFSMPEVFIQTMPGGCDGAPPIGGDDGGGSGSGEINCDNVLLSSTGSQIDVANLAPVSIIKVYFIKANGGWELRGNCSGDCGDTKTFSDLPNGNYLVTVDFYNANYNGKICETSFPITVGTVIEGDGLNPSCEDINITTENATIKVGGLTAPVAQVKLYKINANGGWEFVNGCNGDCGFETGFGSLDDGQYIVDVMLYSTNYAHRICGINEMIQLGGAGNRTSSSRSIQLLALAAYKNKQAVDLQWLTNTGYKNASYAIEKSLNGKNFQPISTVTNTSKDVTTQIFKETDEQPQLGTNYYRLKQIYSDGSFDYTPIQQVNFEWDVNDVSIFPNPAKEVLNINLGQKFNKKASVQLMDALGKIYLEHHFDKSGNNTLQIPIYQLKNGLYYISIKIDNQKVISKKVVVNQWY